jgi:putative transposase
MFFAFCYFILRAVLQIAPNTDMREREAEILVLRHQLAVLSRTNPRPRLRRRDRIVIAGLSGLIPKSRWTGFRRHAGNDRAVASRTRAAQMDVPPCTGRPTTSPSGTRGSDHPDGPGEPALGCRPDQRRAQGLGHRVGATRIRTILRHAGIPPAPRREGPCSEFLRSQAKAKDAQTHDDETVHGRSNASTATGRASQCR